MLDGEDPTGVAELEPREREALAMLLVRYGRSVAGDTLARVGEFCEREGLVDRALAGLRSRRAWRRAQAAFSLGDMASRRAAPALLRALGDDRREVRTAAARSLGRLGVQAQLSRSPSPSPTTRVPKAIGAQALLGLGPGAVPRLRELCRHRDASVRGVAAELLGLLGDAADAGQLSGLLRDPAAEVRARAAQALGRVGAEDALQELRAAPVGSHPVRTHARRARPRHRMATTRPVPRSSPKPRTTSTTRRTPPRRR